MNYMDQDQTLRMHNLGIIQGYSYRVLENHLGILLKKYNLLIPEWKLLGLIFENPNLKITQLASQLKVEIPFITRLVNSLTKKQMVKKVTRNKDLRIQLVELTEETKVLLPKLEIEVGILMRNLLEGITSEERSAYMNVLQTVINNAKKIERSEEL